MEIWQWFQSFERRALLNGDVERLRLTELHSVFWQQVETNPQYSLSMLDEGVALAQHLDEPCWEMFHRYWRIEVYLFYLDDLALALEEAIDLMLLTRKQGYKDCPVIPRVHRIMMDTYVYIDPVGYADDIEGMMQHMESEMQLDYSTRLLIQGRKVKLKEAFEDYPAAVAEAQKLLAMSEYHTFRQAHAVHMLCSLAAVQGQNDLSLQYANEMERLAHEIQRKGTLAMSTAWKCLIYKRRGDNDKAGEMYRQATSQMEKLGTTPSNYYYDILAEYHERDNDIATAIMIRDKQYEELIGRGAYHDVCEYWLKRARLEGRNGHAVDTSIKQAQIAAQDLRKPQHYLSRLQQVIDGDYQDIIQD
ncbi:MAG: hypothetical protein ACPG7F_10190 [Aggregatilineales bacterium]